MAVSFSWPEQLRLFKDRMSEEWEPRYRALQPREQRILQIAAVVIPLTLLVFGLILPLQHERAALLKSVAHSMQQAAEAELLAEQLRNRPDVATASAHEGSLLSRVDQLVTAQNVRSFVTQMRPQAAMDGKQRLYLLLKDIPYRDLAALLLAVDQGGLLAEQMKIQQAQQSGYVQAQLLLAAKS